MKSTQSKTDNAGQKVMSAMGNYKLVTFLSSTHLNDDIVSQEAKC
jgi:hypothetical protein